MYNGIIVMRGIKYASDRWWSYRKKWKSLSYSQGVSPSKAPFVLFRFCAKISSDGVV